MSESYTEGGDFLHLLDPTTLIGQTFSPLEAHKLEFIDLNMKRLTSGGEVSITLHNLTDDPNMIGGGISHTKHVKWSKRMFYNVSRVRFTMSKVQVNPGITYGILLHHTRTPDWNYYHVQGDVNDATYPQGQRFTKDNWSDPPTYYPNDDLIFTEFGDPPTPPTPPDPPIDNFMILDVIQIDTGEGIKFRVITNVPCHLYMLWTHHEPWTHVVPGIRRGVAIVRDVKYCFVDWIVNEQAQPGDTIYHTFVKEPWAICETRWFTFRAKVNDLWSPSVGPIFKKHRFLPPTPEEWWICGEPGASVWALRAWYWFGTTFTPAEGRYLTKVALAICKEPLYVPYYNTSYIRIYHTIDHEPVGDPISETNYDPNDMPWKPNYQWSYFNMPGITLEAGETYALILAVYKDGDKAYGGDVGLGPAGVENCPGGHLIYMINQDGSWHHELNGNLSNKLLGY